MNPQVEALVRALLRPPIAFHRVFAEITGSVRAGLFLSQAWYWTQRVDERQPERQGWFYKSRDEWRSELGLSRREQETARETLRKLGFLLEEERGMPARLWFKLNVEAIGTAIACWAETSQQVGTKRANKLVRNEPTSWALSAQHHENTHETTKEQQHALFAAAAPAHVQQNPAGRYDQETYEKFIRETKPHKTEAQVGGLAYRLRLTAEEDAKVAHWLGVKNRPKPRSDCSTCSGTGWANPDGKGARPCECLKQVA